MTYLTKKMSLAKDSNNHINLLIERDAGNEMLILMGNRQFGLLSWKRLRKLCDQAIEFLEESE